MDSFKNKELNYDKYLSLRNKIISKFFNKMNEPQLKSVLCLRGPVLILAGAGSGKTTAMVNRMANILKFGSGLTESEVNNLTQEDWDFIENYNHDIDYLNPLASKLIFCNIAKPWNVLAITFTNKAADELKNRLEENLGPEIARNVGASTFHSACVKILRRNIDKVGNGYDKSFAIYDSDDTKKIITEIINKMELDTKLFSVKSVVSKISSAKNELMSPEQILLEGDVNNYKLSTIAKIYSVYQDELLKSNALDFDDIIKLTVELFESCPDVLDYYQDKFKYIMVDEYQDTNHAQFRLIYLLSKKHSNICVVGDDDQSIYKFRGATIDNILNFEKYFKNTLVIRLEQNYRSTKTILNVANSVISKNFIRKDKKLWTDNDTGDKVSVYDSVNEYGEAKFVVDTILQNIENGFKYSDNAVLYRTNFQSNIIEQYLVKSGIPYKIIGGLRFYERKEIKDIIAYLSVINNYNDSLRLKRIINEPKRGIGSTTMSIAQDLAQKSGESLFDIINNSDKYKLLSKKSTTLMSFCSLIKDLASLLNKLSLVDFVDQVLHKTGYLKYIEMLGKEGAAKLDNINQLLVNIKKYQESVAEPTLEGFLEEISLYSDPDSVEKEDNSQVLLMTIHSAKGLEFPNVIIIGMEEGIFPGNQVVYDYKDVEEERRLAYVGFTRAKTKLSLVYAKERRFYNKTLVGVPSRFINEIPEDFCEFISQGYPLETKEADKYKTNVAIDRAKAMNARKTLGIGFQTQDKTLDNLSNEITAGSNVKHKIFGIGTVLRAVPMANDTMLEVEFDKVGIKKVMANFAGIRLL
ncbi:MAG: UvrD-helicase domain-containing protein [Oscillospiraceae bacterium]|nr:UvrD-helicase domain-containing protein [Oscillospiraceae bacterium]